MGDDLRIPTWGCFVVAVLALAREWFWPLHTGGASANIFVSLVLAACILVASILNFKGTRNSAALPHASGGLKIHSAHYGVGGPPWLRWFKYKNVLEIVRARVSADSIDLIVSNALLGDPFKGDPKHLLVRYSYAGLRKDEVIPEGHRFSVPPKAETVDGRPALEAKEIIRNAPRISIEHRHDQNNARDVLVLRNDKDEDARDFRFEEINVLVKHRIVFPSPVPPVSGGGPPRECPIDVYNGATNNKGRLYDVLHDDPTNSVETVRVYYAGGPHQFYRDFKLREDARTQTVTWDPLGPVCQVARPGGDGL